MCSDNNIYKIGFDAVVPKNANVLILGSIPSDKSIYFGQYYAHPQNRFWRVLSSLLSSETPETYAQKIELLFHHRIALWDVVHQAIRPGSLDSAIRDEIPNDIVDFLRKHPSISCVCFNGKKAGQLYDRYFERLPTISYYQLPSTSPANAGCSLSQLLASWKKILLRG